MNPPRYYILTPDAPQTPTATDVQTWATWLETAWAQDCRVVGVSPYPGGEVSTVFLGLDHRFGQGGPAILFETLVFGGPWDGWMARYTTWSEAEAGHRAALAMIAADPLREREE